MKHNATKKIIVVCHDAGGAEIVSSYVRKHSERESFLCYVAGPAQKIFARKGIPTVSLDRKNFLIKDILSTQGKIKYLLCGSSWASNVEKDFIFVAKELGITTVVYLDHWINYRERFGYPNKNWQKNLPEEIWVGDVYALKLAKQNYRSSKDLKIKLVRNEYFKEVVEESHNQPAHGLTTILFIGEPISEALNIYTDKKIPPVTEFDLLKKICETFHKRSSKVKVIIRLHPAESKDKYNALIKSFSRKIKVHVSREQYLVRDLARADVVIGMSSMALALAYVAGKKTMSVLPKPLSTCPIPFPLIKLRSFTSLERTLSKLLLNY